MGAIGPGKSKTRFISKRYPVEEGLTADTTKQTGSRHLTPEKSFVREKDKIR